MTLVNIIENWLITDPKLCHFRIIRMAYNWLTCDCIDHAWTDYPSFQITDDGLVIHNSWTKEYISAADPSFFIKLRDKITEECKVLNDDFN